MNMFLKQLWLSFKIWLIAVAANTILGTLYLSDFKLHAVADLIIVGTCLGAFFSFPIMIIISVIINRCAAAGVTGWYILSLLFIATAVLATIAFMIFCGGFSLSGDMIILLCFAIFSGLTGITIFYRSILKWGSDYNNIPKI
jgi:hypothetical protein